MTGPDSARFARGQAIAHRSVDRAAGIVMTVIAQIVVQDDGDLIVTYMPDGAMAKRRSGRRGGGPRGRQLLEWDGRYEDGTWSRTNVLMIHRPGDPFSLWSAWDRDWSHAWWYVNLEEPGLRTPIGFDTRDHDVDLYAASDRAEWHWKDEDELAWAVEHGRFTSAEARSFREDADRALELVRRGDPPFDLSWAAWRPDPTWTAPALPKGWDQL